MMLDVGTGPGHWVIEVADKYGSANVIGIDLSPIQPEDVPPNAEFRVADLTEDMYMFHDHSMDLVHSRYSIWKAVSYYRMIKAGVLEHQWDPYIREVFRILKPGTGYAQFIETGLAVWDGNDVPEGTPFQLVSLSLLHS
jgi:ubiquinone/menaquinone biosynthesis C-methylase UbiE